MPQQPPLTHPDIPPLPPQSTFSILPDIYLLLSRLAPLQTPNQASQTAQSQQPTSQPATQPPTLNGLPPIQTKSLPAEIYPIKQKIQAARDALTVLPDMQRSIAEQEAEIKMLEAKVRGFKGRLELLGEKAKGTQLGSEVAKSTVQAESKEVEMGDG
jgi:hypothetical protein